MKRKIINTILILTFMSLPAAARERAYGWCQQGGTSVTLNSFSGYGTTPKVQGSYPNCTVTVYLSGTSTLATLYSDNNGTAKSNPFTADSTGFWFFYADNGRYDASMSGAGIPANTLGDLYLGDLFNASVTVQSLNNIYIADAFCNTSGVYDQSCLANAITAAGNNARIILSPHPYSWASKVTASNLVNVFFDWTGALVNSNGAAFECDGCTGGGVTGGYLTPITVPAVVIPGNLPTSNQNEAVVIDRWGTGKGYFPTINDTDLAPTSIGGSCTTKCLSTAQLNVNITTGIIYRNASGVSIKGVTGSYFYIGFYDSSNIVVSDNIVSGGAGPTVSNGGYSDGGGDIYFWHESNGNGNHDITIHGNIATFSAASGIMIAGGDHFTVGNNVLSYNGESGFKTYQNSPEQVAYATITGNTARYNWYDGFDIGSTFPHNGSFLAHSVASGNYSSYNHGTGFYGDGKDWVFTGNEASNNATIGIGLDFNNSVISGNHSYNNNTANATWHEIVVSPGISPTGDTVVGNSTNTNGNGGSYGLYTTMTNGVIVGNVESTGSNFFAGTAPHWFDYDMNGPDASTAMLNSQQVYTFGGSEFSGSAGWYKLGTWVAGTSTYTPSGPIITIGTGQAANSGNNQQAVTTIIIRTGNGSTAPNLSGLTAFVYGDGQAITGLKAAATSGSSSASNGSWDIWVQQGTYGGGFYTVSVPLGSTWANSGAAGSDPGSASSTVVVGNVNNPVDNGGNAHFAGYYANGTAGITTTLPEACGSGTSGTVNVTNGLTTGATGCH